MFLPRGQDNKGLLLLLEVLWCPCSASIACWLDFSWAEPTSSQVCIASWLSIEALWSLQFCSGVRKGEFRWLSAACVVLSPLGSRCVRGPWGCPVLLLVTSPGARRAAEHSALGRDDVKLLHLLSGSFPGQEILRQ